MERGRKGHTTKRFGILATTGILWLALGGLVHAEGATRPPSGRGWVWGGGLGGGRLSFPGGGDLALAVGKETGSLDVPSAGETIAVRGGELIDSSRSPDSGAAHLAPLPSTDGSVEISFHVGYAFSRRVAVLLSTELVAGVGSGFSSAQGGVVVRYRPTSRFWIEAGPASGDLRYGYEGTIVEKFTDTGYGVRTGVGVTVLRRPRWVLDLQGRFGTLQFDGFRATSVSVGLSASSRP